MIIRLDNPFVILLLAAAAVCMGLLFIAGRYRQTPGSGCFILFMLAMGAWTAMYALELGAVSLTGKRFWAQAQYLAIPYAPVAWLTFLLAYTGRGDWLTGRRLAALLVVPLTTSLLAVTDAGHGLVLRSTQLAAEGDLHILVRDFGGWFWFHTIYSYALLAAGCLLIGISLNRTPSGIGGKGGFCCCPV